MPNLAPLGMWDEIVDCGGYCIIHFKTKKRMKKLYGSKITQKQV